MTFNKTSSLSRPSDLDALEAAFREVETALPIEGVGVDSIIVPRATALRLVALARGAIGAELGGQADVVLDELTRLSALVGEPIVATYDADSREAFVDVGGVDAFDLPDAEQEALGKLTCLLLEKHGELLALARRALAPEEKGEPKCAEPGCRSQLSWRRTGGEWTSEKRDNAVAVRCLDCASVLCPYHAEQHFALERRLLDTELAKLRKLALLAQQLEGVQEGHTSHSPVRLALVDWYEQLARNDLERAGLPRRGASK